VASGTDWFVNWADFPSVRALGDGVLVAHWLARVGEATYAYGVELAVSRDEGASWSAPIVPHRDGTETEHGFVSLLPVLPDRMGVVWLDGRETGGGEGGHDAHEEHGAGGPMTLRFTTIDAEGTLGEEVLLDDRVCDCCGTDAVLAGAARALIVYRDRSDGEVRDISRVLESGAGWSAPAPVHEDGWTIAGCPVNGPAAASFGNRVAVAWFTGADDVGRVRVAFSEDGGEHFESPITLDTPDPLGRVDVEMDPDGSAIVSWLEAGAGDAATINVHRVTMQGKESALFDPVPTRGDRASGFPQLVRLGDRLILAWTELGEPNRVRTAIYR
jgi:hypothetical protein